MPIFSLNNTASRNESTTPLLKSSGFGKSPFGLDQKGSRTTSYVATPEIDSIRPGGANFQSICAMQTYKNKSHEELRSYFPRIMEVKPSPIMPPAETQPSVQFSVEHPNLATSIQYGISNLPVSNNPAPVRRRPLLIIQYSSLCQHRLPPQKYKPTSDKPKVPFFMDKENTSGVLRTEVVTIPRENPRDWVRPAAEGMHDGDKVGDKPKLEPEEMHYDNCGDDKDVARHFAT